MNDMLQTFIKLRNEYEQTLPRKKRSNLRSAILKDIERKPLRKREIEAVEGFIKFLKNKILEELR